MKPPWVELLEAARQEVEETVGDLPSALRDAAQPLPVAYERRPSSAMVQDGLDPDVLGLFVGESRAGDDSLSLLPPRIFLFLENLWEFAEGDWEIFLDEVQTTYLHELGHYLGLGEIDLEDRGLE